MTNEKLSYATSSRRSAAVTIDLIIVTILRLIVAQIIGSVFIESMIVKFMQDFKLQFGTEIVKRDVEHVNFILHHPTFYAVIAFYILILLIGAVYHSYLNSSSWQATIGKRVMKIMMVKENGLAVSFKRALLHYSLSILPFVYALYISAYAMQHQISFFEAITNNGVNLILGVMAAAWLQIQVISKRKTTAYDLICRTVLIKGKTDSGKPLPSWKS